MRDKILIEVKKQSDIVGPHNEGQHMIDLNRLSNILMEFEFPIIEKYTKNKVVIEKPVIPKFVADWVEEHKEQPIYKLLDSDSIFDIHDELARWLLFGNEKTKKKREINLVLAHIYGFGIEEEPNYYAKIKGYELVSDSEDGYWNVDGKELSIDNAWNDYSGYKTTILTKDEWAKLGVNEDNADFVKVEELEE